MLRELPGVVHRCQFSIRALLLVTLLVAVMLATFNWIGHYVLFAASALLCLASGWRLLGRPANWQVKLLLGSVSLFLACTTYVLSIGPASWMLARYDTCDTPRPSAEAFYSRLYIPVATAVIDAPDPIRRAGMWYVTKWMPEGTQFHADWPDGMGWSSQSRQDPSKGWTYTVVHY